MYASVQAALVRAILTNATTSITSPPSPSSTPRPSRQVELASIPWAAIVVGGIPALLLCAIVCMWCRRRSQTRQQRRSSNPSNSDEQLSSKPLASSSTIGAPPYPRFYHPQAPNEDASQPPSIQLSSNASSVPPVLRGPLSSAKASMEVPPRYYSDQSTSLSYPHEARRATNGAQGRTSLEDGWKQWPNGSTGSRSFDTHVSSAADYVESNPLAHFSQPPPPAAAFNGAWQLSHPGNRQDDVSDTFMYATSSSTTAEYGYEATMHAAPTADLTPFGRDGPNHRPSYASTCISGMPSLDTYRR
ncbi:hypothetical protein AaE_011819 [Aphanomyces astaci]|uniref:Uncharacterized protein n=1 Tax=Aphanomyces astaci TaxID=112090 RepID=A0A6A4ZN98_APHAT|nr:hypothetical protein AaE_011819 [Aphanomyces astaci]